jgi:hypothetical protein
MSTDSKKTVRKQQAGQEPKGEKAEAYLRELAATLERRVSERTAGLEKQTTFPRLFKRGRTQPCFPSFRNIL